MSGALTRRLALLAGVVVLLIQGPPAWSAQQPLLGRSVQAVLDEYRAEGLPIIYTSDLVDPSLTVQSEPEETGAVQRLRAVLAPHGLALLESGGSWLVVRQAPTSAPAALATASDAHRPGLENEPLELEALSISASRYVLFSNSQFFIDQRAIQALPDLGEDPLRSTHRLPGAAAGGLSSRSHFRGGEHNETAIYLNGLKLLDPFHIRDYHSIFSSIDARAISGIEAYTGGFPVNYGDQMSGVLVLDSMQPEEPVHTEIGLSVYNTSLLNSGYTRNERVDWLVSVRSSNLDLVLDDSLGKPDYFDVFAELGVRLSENHHLSFNLLYADDRVTVITESNPEELEQSVSKTKNKHAWLTLESQWSPDLSGRIVLSDSALENDRDAEANDPERMFARVTDQRVADITGLQADWVYSGLAMHTVRWGLGLRREEANYRYRALAEYRGFFEFYPGIENPTSRDVSARPEGNSYSLYVSDRWQLTEQSGLEVGLRWDRQTYTRPTLDDQFSPRISLLHRLGQDTDLRLTWGRYHQSQAIHELQVEDGVDRFFAPQRANHWIAGVQHRFDGGYRLRIEGYLKDYERLKPRFENLFDPLALIPELAPDRVMLLPESARAYGLETTLEYRGGDGLDWWASYSWSKATDRIGGGDQRRSWDQRHAVQTGLAWSKGPWEVGVALSIHSGWPTTGMSFEVVPLQGFASGDDQEEEDIILPVPGPRNAEQLGTFAQLDLRISREIPVKIGRFSVFFEVTNATNRKNECCIDFDIDEDEEGNRVLDRAVEHWLPIVPAVGLFWEF